MKKSDVDPATIRALSAPNMAVRHTRTSLLRKVFSVNNADLAYMVHPPMGETNPVVIGQNKSVAKKAEKSVHSWYRARTYYTERLDRLEDEVYERLCTLERKKMDIERIRLTEDSTERSNTVVGGVVFSDEEPYLNGIEGNGGIVENGAGVVNGGEEKTVDEAEKEVQKTGVSFAASDENAKTEDNAALVTEVSKGEKKDVVKSDKEPTGDKTKKDKKSKSKDKDKAFESILETAVRVAKESGDELAFRVNPLVPRPVTQGALGQGEKGEGADRPVTHAGRLLATPGDTRAAQQRLLTADSPGRMARPGGANPSARSPKLQRHSKGDQFVYWRKDQHGRITESEIPYRRREFEVRYCRSFIFFSTSGTTVC